MIFHVLNGSQAQRILLKAPSAPLVLLHAMLILIDMDFHPLGGEWKLQNYRKNCTLGLESTIKVPFLTEIWETEERASHKEESTVSVPPKVKVQEASINKTDKMSIAKEGKQKQMVNDIWETLFGTFKVDFKGALTRQTLPGSQIRWSTRLSIKKTFLCFREPCRENQFF